MPLSTSYKNALLNLFFNQTNWTAPSAVYASLHTADPGGTGASEVSGSGYARVNVTAAFPDASAGAISNDVVIIFPTVTSPGYSATHLGFWTASSGGTFMGSLDINPDMSFAVGAIPEIPIGELDASGI